MINNDTVEAVLTHTHLCKPKSMGYYSVWVMAMVLKMEM